MYIYIYIYVYMDQHICVYIYIYILVDHTVSCYLLGLREPPACGEHICERNVCILYIYIYIYDNISNNNI